jgi:hypothetical protein
MKVFLFITLIFAGPVAMAGPLTCELASGSDPLQSFQLVDDGETNVSINGVQMRDIAPDSPYGVFYSPAFRDYNFSPRPSTPGPSVDVVKRDGSRLIYHCAGNPGIAADETFLPETAAYRATAPKRKIARKQCFPIGPAAYRLWPLSECR